MNQRKHTYLGGTEVYVQIALCYKLKATLRTDKNRRKMMNPDVPFNLHSFFTENHVINAYSNVF